MDVIGPLQLRVMNYIWEHGASTVHQVHDALNAAKGAQKLAYTTILTLVPLLAVATWSTLVLEGLAPFLPTLRAHRRGSEDGRRHRREHRAAAQARAVRRSRQGTAYWH